jgi:hypothetical protein
MTLMTLAAYLFFRLVRKESVKNYTLYVFAGAALVNTHYYGVLLVVFNAVFYVAFNRKRLFLKKTFCFIAANVVIALSLLPFFIITAFQKALLNSGFNAGIPSPDKKDSVIFVILCLSCYLFFQVKQKSKAIKSLSAQSSGFFDYILYAGAFIFISAYIISLKRPILIWRYLSSLLPFLIMLFSLGVSYSKLGPVIRMGFVMALIPFSISFTAFGGGAYDVPQEILEYIDADVQTHSLKAAELNIRNSSYYGFAKIDAYSDTKDCDVVYVRYSDKSELRRLLSAAGLDEKNVLEIRIDNENYIGKKYISPKADD